MGLTSPCRGQHIGPMQDPFVTPEEPTAAEAIEAIEGDLDLFDDWMDRYGFIIDLGRKLPPFPPEWQDDAHRVPGCQSKVWMEAVLRDGRMFLAGASDAAIVSGLVALLLRVYSGPHARRRCWRPARIPEGLGLLRICRATAAAASPRWRPASATRRGDHLASGLSGPEALASGQRRRFWSDGTRVGLFLACFFAAGAVLTAYLPLWLADRGLSAAAIGDVLGLASLLRVVAVPGWGWVADRLGRDRSALFAAAAVRGAAARRCCPARPDLPRCGAGRARRRRRRRAGAAHRRDDAGAGGGAAARLWAHAGLGLGLLHAGHRGGRRLARTGRGRPRCPGCWPAGYGVAALLSAGDARPAALAGQARPGGVGRLGRPFRLALLATALIQGSHAAYYAFASLHWRAAGIPDAVIGLLIAEGIVAEIALFIWGRGLVERLGPARLTALAAARCLLRWTVTAFTVAVPVLAAVQLLHAATFACQHLSAMLVLRALPPGGRGWRRPCWRRSASRARPGSLIWVSGRVYGAAGGSSSCSWRWWGGRRLLVAPSSAGRSAPSMSAICRAMRASEPSGFVRGAADGASPVDRAPRTRRASQARQAGRSTEPARPGSYCSAARRPAMRRSAASATMRGPQLRRAMRASAPASRATGWSPDCCSPARGAAGLLRRIRRGLAQQRRELRVGEGRVRADRRSAAPARSGPAPSSAIAARCRAPP